MKMGNIAPIFGLFSLLSYVVATFKVILRQVLICDSAHSWWPVWCFPTWKPGCQHHQLISHSVTLSWQWTSPCPTLIMPSTWLGSNKCHSILIGLTKLCVWTHDLPLHYRFGNHIQSTSFAFQDRMLTIRSPRFIDVTTLATPTCICGSLSERLVQTLALTLMLLEL